MARTRVSEQSAVEELLADPRYEILPFLSFEEQVEAMPAGAHVAITASPDKGVDLTVDRSVELAEQGYEVSAHVAARAVRDEDHLDEIAGRLADAGVSDLFVPGGDNEEAGEYESSYELLTALDDLGYEFEEVGITGYPEGHKFIDDETLAEAMAAKEPHATYMVTQLCYDAETVAAWLEKVREREIDLPVYVGVPGVMKYQKLLKISRRVGVGESIKFAQKTTGVFDFVKQLVGSRGKYTPEDLINGLAPYYEDPTYDIEGLHLYTFNRTPDTEDWRRTVLER